MRPLSLRPSQRTLALVAPLVLTLALRGLGAGERHLALVKSDPANAATVPQSPKAITLWFSQRPNLKLTRVVLTGATRDTVKTGAPADADSAGKQIRVAIVSTLPGGKYDVSWRTLSRDGHAVAGKFAFTIDPTANVVPTAAPARKPR